MAFQKEKSTEVGALVRVLWSYPAPSPVWSWGLSGKVQGSCVNLNSYSFSDILKRFRVFVFFRLLPKQCLSELNKYQNPFEDLVKHKLLGPEFLVQ